MTDRGDGRMEMENGAAVLKTMSDEQTERTEQTKDWRRTDEDSRQRTVDADSRRKHKDENPVTKKLYIHGSTRRNSINQRRARG